MEWRLEYSVLRIYNQGIPLLHILHTCSYIFIHKSRTYSKAVNHNLLQIYTTYHSTFNNQCCSCSGSELKNWSCDIFTQFLSESSPCDSAMFFTKVEPSRDSGDTGDLDLETEFEPQLLEESQCRPAQRRRRRKSQAKKVARFLRISK